MKRYNPADIEPKWQQKWASNNLFAAKDFDESRPKYVMLTEFPYPSGDGLHLGHVREYTLADIMARHRRMNGYNVLYPMGYDAFGLPTENYAIKNKIAPQVATERNVATFQKQFESMGLSIDWSRSFRTTDPDYYKWTQWLFLQFFKAGLAYQEEIAINWCPFCKTGLANEEVVNGRHERCDTLVEKKTLKQWLLKITAYADRLIDGLEDVDYPSRIADQQINWIGRSKGAEVEFKIEGHDASLQIFTTRPDTILGATFMVLAPEHELVEQITTDGQRAHVHTYLKAAQAKSDIERQNTDREKTGVFTGTYAINPVNNEHIPIWIADYVLAGYGTGAIMAVPAHDERDYAFARAFDLDIREVVAPEYGERRENEQWADGATVIVYDQKTDTFLGLDWEGGWTGLVAGGINEGEDYESCARRELAEEAGINEVIEFIPLGGPVFAHYEHRIKKLNRVAKTQGFLAIVSDRQGEAAQREAHETFVPAWYSGEELYNLIEARLTGNGHWLELVRRACEYVEAKKQGQIYDFVAYRTGEGIMINSGELDGLAASEAREKIVEILTERGVGKERVNYRLRDWIFSRQHYWGEPIPIIHCDEHGAVAVPDDQLPVVLPEVDHYEPTDSGESPLASIETWVNVACPVCGKPAKRETDTMPNWAGSSWYYLRYFDAHNDKVFADREKLNYWGEADLYLGGMEHTTLHLLYSRFWHQFFYDQGLVPTPEPYKARRGQGIVLAADGTKMSKSKGNVINPTDIIENGYGADALRLAIAFLAPYDQTTPWNPEGVTGTYRFLQRLWTLTQEVIEAADESSHKTISPQPLLHATHQVIKKVSEDLYDMNFNTAIAALMEAVNSLYKLRSELPMSGYRDDWYFAVTSLTQLLAPFAPHIGEELWQELAHEGSVHTSEWPKWNQAYLVADTIKIVIQVNGRLRAELEVTHDADEATIKQLALDHENTKKFTLRQAPKRIVYVPGRLVNIVL